jgi:phenylalanyl-tRNA synthetase alpha chain
MLEKIHNILSQAKKELEIVNNLIDLDNIKITYLGKKGHFTSILRSLGSLSPEERPILGKKINNAKAELEELISSKKDAFARISSGTKRNYSDLSLPGRKPHKGAYHPIAQILNEVSEIFINLGFTVSHGPEIELDFYNFEALNIPEEHPARDMQDTFYVSDKVVLRTHTSPIQIRTMESRKPPLKIIAPGKVYRCDSDITHTPMFHQIEGLHVDRDLSFSHLKGILIQFLQEFFTPDTKVRFRPSFFPFTEPSAEVDIGCIICGGAGCRVCKGTGWLEVLGAGMVHPQVFRNVGYDPEEFTGYAFGLGIERFTMLRYAINDIRLYYENDIRFLEQFI